MNNSSCGGFQSKWNVLPEHVEFASLGFIQSLGIDILTRQFICHKCHFEIHKDKRKKNKGWNFQDFEDNLIC